MHVAPVVPQVTSPEVWQTPLPSQQPLGQLVLSHWHAPATHSCPFGMQSTQLAALTPQDALTDDLHKPVAASQQPEAQLLALQATQLLAAQ